MSKIFTVGVAVYGGLHSRYCFESKEAANSWIATEFPLLEKEYGGLTHHTWDLPGLKIGDKCYVSGDGDEVYTIEGITQYSPNRWGFILDSGFSEEVCKCGITFLG